MQDGGNSLENLSRFWRDRIEGRSETSFAIPGGEEAFLTWNRRVRGGHRWLSMIFTATVVANFGAMAFGEPPVWIVYSPLAPLLLLLLSGFYLFALPYVATWRSASRASGAD